MIGKIRWSTRIEATSNIHWDGSVGWSLREDITIASASTLVVVRKYYDPVVEKIVEKITEKEKVERMSSV